MFKIQVEPRAAGEWFHCQVLDILWRHFMVYLTIIPRARVGYEMIDSQRGGKRRVGYNHLISNKRKWNNCFIKNNREILLDLNDFAVQDRPEGNLMVAISRPWYNCSYTMAAKPIKSLELHYTMMQFLIKEYRP